MCPGKKQGCKAAVREHLDVPKAGWGGGTSAVQGCVGREPGWLKSRKKKRRFCAEQTNSVYVCMCVHV